MSPDARVGGTDLAAPGSLSMMFNWSAVARVLPISSCNTGEPSDNMDCEMWTELGAGSPLPASSC